MSLTQIAQIAKLDHTDKQTLDILALYENQIISWLNSKEFHSSHWGPYVPLLNPDSLDYAFLHPFHAWILNLPLKHYDFVAFGSKFSGLDTARGYLLACDAHGISSTSSSSYESYMSFYQNLLIYADMKEKEEISSIYLLLDDFVLDNDANKLYSLIDASLALHVVRDPISALCASLCASKLSSDFVFDENSDLQTALQAALQSPNIDINSHLSNIKELYHDGFMFKLLSPSMKSLCLKEYSDFDSAHAFATTCEIASTLGLKAPQNGSFFSGDPQSFAGILPLKIQVNTELCLYLTSVYDTQFGIYKDIDISPAFTLAHHSMRALLAKPDDALTLLKNKELFAKTKELVELASKKVLELEISPNINEAEILEFLLTHDDTRKLAKSVLDQHLMLLKQLAPALVQSFSRYQAFELLCAKDI
ncbi:MAG: DUF2972 domain-containing protein [Campylobacter sp.]|nr:DUF2972 domain-containing protein [Campylobacter sp.]